ncbi:MAG: hypothetical protein ACYS21_12200, partial [Planctomycetota bacterium]
MSMKKNVRIWLVVSLFFLVIAAAANAKTIYVDVDANSSGTGANWANAYNYLQDALADADASAKPVDIRVAQGTYTPDSNSADPNGSGDREATFGLINGVTLKGGYAGFGETDPNARDVSLYETILSGDLDGNDVPVANPSDLLTEPTRGENSLHVVTAEGVDANSSFDGFTITAGNANGSAYPDNAAGGMDSDNSTVTLLNCTLTANSASYGGGMSRWDDLDRLATVTNCIFNDNFAASSGGGIYGERMALTDCTFSGNSAGNRGALYNVGNATLTNCTFSGNSSDTFAGGM